MAGTGESAPRRPTMLVQVMDSTEARRLQLDGYSRQGNKAVEAQYSDLESILDRDDVKVKKVSLHRRNGDDEASVIDCLIQSYSGEVEYAYVSTPYSQPGDFGVQTRMLFKITEDKLTVRRSIEEFFAAVENEGKDLPLRQTSPEEFDEMKQEAIGELREQIAEREKKIDEIEETALDDLIPPE